MTRSLVLIPGKEHPNPCKDWIEYCSKKRISYVWAVCDCSQMERSYEIYVLSQWIPVKYCPFCGEIINKIEWKLRKGKK